MNAPKVLDGKSVAAAVLAVPGLAAQSPAGPLRRVLTRLAALAAAPAATPALAPAVRV